MAIRRKVIDTVVAIFKKHGGVELDTPVFELKEVLTGKYGEDSKLIYDLEDQGGEKCALRYDLTVPFARFMANNTNIQKIKRFHIGKVYRRDQPTINKGRFREFYQCDFDIAGKYDAMIPDAEVLAIMQEILEALTVHDFLVKVNHRRILEAVIREAGCNEDLFKAICSSIDKLDKQPWTEVRAELLTKGVTDDQAEVIGKLVSFRGEPLKLLDELVASNVFAKNAEFLAGTFDDMRKLFVYLTALQRIGKVSFDLSLARGLDYYTGLIYEIVLTDKTT
jgi:histidyl-tRNA synthetase